MSQDETAVQSTGAPATASTTAKPPEPPVDIEQIRKQAKAEGWREAQSRFDRERAEARKREQAVRESARERLAKLGDQGASDWENQFETLQKAREYDRWQEEARKWDEWNAHVKAVAEAHRLAPDDPRLAGVDSARELAEKARAAMAEDAAKERKRLLDEAQAADKKAVQGKIEAGELDTLDSGGGAAASGQDALMKEYRKRVTPLRGQIMQIQALKREFRGKGLKI